MKHAHPNTDPLEVDFATLQRWIVELPEFVDDKSVTAVYLLEAKASRTVMPGMAMPMQRLASAWRKRSHTRTSARMLVVHRPPRSGTQSRALAPGVEALPWQEFVAELSV